MRKQKRTAPWVVLLQGTAASLAAYGVGLLLLTALILSGKLPGEQAFSWIIILGVLAAWAGGVLCLHRLPWRPLLNAAAPAAAFAGILLLAGMSCGGINWTGEGGGLLTGIGVAALLLGAVGSRKRRRRKLRV